MTDILGQKTDLVNSPPHYNMGEIECIDAIEAALGTEGFVNYCRGNAIKYLWRVNYKGNAEQDYGKAIWYLQRAKASHARCAQAKEEESREVKESVQKSTIETYTDCLRRFNKEEVNIIHDERA